MTTTHISKPTGASQCARILQLLEYRDGAWTEMPHLARNSGAYAVHSRISDLRKRGHVIQHKNVQKGREVHSFYRLIK